MQIKKRHKLPINHSQLATGSSRSDFSSILYESSWGRFVDKVKPFMKILFVVAFIGGSIYGCMSLFISKDGGKQPTEYVNDNTDRQSDDQEELRQCLDDVAKNNPLPETSNPEFYKQLINDYNKRLGCYDQYPNVDLVGKAQLEENRKSAMDSSGGYKSIHLADEGGNNHKISTNSYINPTTGCSYTLSESEYIKCTDNYNSQNSISVSRALPPATTHLTPTPSIQTESTKKPPTTPAPSTSTSSVDYTALNECLKEANSHITEASKARARQYCFQTQDK